MEFSDKQKAVLNTYIKENNFFSLLSGSIRSGKSYIAILAFFLYTQALGKGRVNLIVGRNLRIMEIELLDTLATISANYGSMYSYARTKGVVEINGVRYIVVAAHDEHSYKRIQSLTAGSALIDEIQLLPENFVNQLIARLSFKDSKILATCNPEGAKHWLKVKFIDTKKIGYLKNFTLDDNPTLPEEVKSRYRDMFTGIFYKRNILGEWVQAEGVIYKEYEIMDRFDYYVKDIISSDVGVDYGIKGITAYEKLDYMKNGTCVVSKSYRYNGADGIKTDSQLADDLIKFIGESSVRSVYIDPSASSYVAELRRRKTKFVVIEADNKVLPGIKTVMNGFASKKLVILNGASNQPLVDELTSYSWMPKVEDKPIKADDHHCDALRYGYYTRNKTFNRGVYKLPRGL
jgi:PBSX family phage terminase large subunit